MKKILLTKHFIFSSLDGNTTLSDIQFCSYVFTKARHIYPAPIEKLDIAGGECLVGTINYLY